MRQMPGLVGSTQVACPTPCPCQWVNEGRW